MKAFLTIWILWVLLYLLGLFAITYAAVHFILKYW